MSHDPSPLKCNAIPTICSNKYAETQKQLYIPSLIDVAIIHKIKNKPPVNTIPTLRLDLALSLALASAT